MIKLKMKKLENHAKLVLVDPLLMLNHLFGLHISVTMDSEHSLFIHDSLRKYLLDTGFNL